MQVELYVIKHMLKHMLRHMAGHMLRHTAGLTTAYSLIGGYTALLPQYEVSRVLFLGICLDFHYFLGRVGFPKL